MAQLFVQNSCFLLPQTLQEITHRSPFKMASVVTLTNVETPWSLIKNPPAEMSPVAPSPSPLPERDVTRFVQMSVWYVACNVLNVSVVCRNVKR